MKITFPPDDISECGGWRNSRQYEALPNIFPIVSYLIMLWCVGNHMIAFVTANGDQEVFHDLQMKFGAMKVVDPFGEPIWKYLTTCFIHSSTNLLHVIFNMMWLFLLGPLIERGIGSVKFLLFVIVTGFVSSALQTSLDGAGVGFSGVVYAMCGFMWAAWPRWTGFLEKFRGSTVKFMLFYMVLCFFIPGMRVGNIAHLSGLIIGGTIGLWACWGNRNGFKWLLATIAIVAISITVVFWSPWNRYYNLRQWSEKEAPTIHEAFEVMRWESKLRLYYPDSY